MLQKYSHNILTSETIVNKDQLVEIRIYDILQKHQQN